MTPAERLQPYIVASHRAASGLAPLPDGPTDPLAVFRDDPETLAYAKAEIVRLRAPGQRVLAEHDHESKLRCQALERMVAGFGNG